MLCTPATSVLVLQAAAPATVSGTVPHPEIVAPESMKLTTPVGAAPVTAAVKVTVVPDTTGFAELVSAVVVGAVGLGVEPQLPLTFPVPSRRNVAVARHPGAITICCADAPPKATGAIGCGDWNERSLDEFA